MKIDGKDFKLIEQKMRRSRMEIRTRAAELLQPEKTRSKHVVKHIYNNNNNNNRD